MGSTWINFENYIETQKLKSVEASLDDLSTSDLELSGQKSKSKKKSKGGKATKSTPDLDLDLDLE